VRFEILSQIPAQVEPPGRVPDVTPDLFVAIVSHIEDPSLAAPFWCLALTGFRISEYLACDTHHLLPHTHRVRFPSGKTGAEYVSVDPVHWGWIERGIPCRLGRKPESAPEVQFDPRYKRMRRLWAKACEAQGVSERPTFHDLRHCHAQWATDAGQDERKVGDQLGHKNAATTRRYTRTRNKGEVARAVGGELTKALERKGA